MKTLFKVTPGRLIQFRQPERREMTFATEAGGHWITIGGFHEGETSHKGGTPVFINGEGRIEKGPGKLAGKNLSQLSGFAPEGSEPHQMTKKQFHQHALSERQRLAKEHGKPEPQEEEGFRKATETFHREHIRRALRKGKHVGAGIMSEWPDLAEKKAESSGASGKAYLASLRRNVPETMGGGTTPDPNAQQLLKHPDVDRIAAEIPKGSTHIPGGFDAVVFRTPKGDILRIGPAQERPKIPEVLQPISVKKFGNVVAERLPLVDTKNITEQDVADMSKRLKTKGFVFTDPGTDNLGRLPNGTLVTIDPGAVRASEKPGKKTAKQNPTDEGKEETSKAVNDSPLAGLSKDATHDQLLKLQGHKSDQAQAAYHQLLDKVPMPQNAVAIASEIPGLLAAFKQANPYGDLPTWELYDALRKRHPDLTPAQQQKVLKHLAEQRKVRLHDFTGAVYTIKYPEHILPMGGTLKGYVSLK